MTYLCINKEQTRFDHEWKLRQDCELFIVKNKQNEQLDTFQVI